MKFPVKFINDNLIINYKNECFVYYHLKDYNYGYLSEDEKMRIHNMLNEIFTQHNSSDVHMLVIGAESSISNMNESFKKEIRGDLKDIAVEHIDDITEELTKKYGKNQVKYRHYIGFKLNTLIEDINLKNILKELKLGFIDFANSVNSMFINDFTKVNSVDIEKYKKLEKLLYKRVNKRFRLEKITSKDYGYIINHLYCKNKCAYEDYSYKPKPVELGGLYDILRLSDSFISEKEKYLKISNDDNKEYVSYLVVSNVTSELDFPGSEILFDEASLDFPIDVSIRFNVLQNKEALTKVRNKSKELKDLDEHILTSNNDSSSSLVDARDNANELEAVLDKTKESMYKLNYVVRISANSLETLEERVSTVKDFYSDYKVVVERPFGDMLNFQYEFLPASEIMVNDYIQYVTSDFIASLGFGATSKLGEENGIYIGYNLDNNKIVNIKPAIAAQGIKGSITNSPSMAFVGATGNGKSMLSDLIDYYCALLGSKLLIIDPKSERGNWKEDLIYLRDHINIINLTSDIENKGLLDPYNLFDLKMAETIAVEILSYLTGITIKDSKRFPVLKKYISLISDGNNPCMTKIVEALKNSDNEVAKEIGIHIESFVDLGFSILLFGDGETEKKIDVSKAINIIQIEDLKLPDKEIEQKDYSSMEILSIAMLMVVSYFAVEFIEDDRSVFKISHLDEAWVMSKVQQGRVLVNKLVRVGRSKNSGASIATQSALDLDDDAKNNIGMKFVFRSTKIEEIEADLDFLGLEVNKENIDAIKNLETGQCLFQDIYGHIGRLDVDLVFSDLFNAFDTRPPMNKEGEENV
ncbi:ATP-binding protein [Clostridium paridis]|uniref:ATP-binding protein n=1 Tax=Clostridium paridis TaxID=2803863 RepID=A0A937K5F2_9CLOT|nr:ATP-binding protein [Clostridium paridis]MBL4932265.1 ATP-binding protein [Clostridium paridis]